MSKWKKRVRKPRENQRAKERTRGPERGEGGVGGGERDWEGLGGGGAPIKQKQDSEMGNLS